MAKEVLIKRTLNTLSKLPMERIKEVSDFADFLLKRYDEESLRSGMEKLMNESETFDFLKKEEDLYSVEDLKVKYGER